MEETRRYNKDYLIRMRKSDCAKYLTKDEISGILKSLGMRRDGSLKAEQTENANMVFFYQPLKAA